MKGGAVLLYFTASSCLFQLTVEEGAVWRTSTEHVSLLSSASAGRSSIHPFGAGHTPPPLSPQRVSTQTFLYILCLRPTLKALHSAPFIIYGRLAAEINDDNETSGSGWRERERRLKEGKTQSEEAPACCPLAQSRAVTRSRERCKNMQGIRFQRGCRSGQTGPMSKSAEFSHFLCLGSNKQ